MLFRVSKKSIASLALAAIGFTVSAGLAAPLAGAQDQQCITVGFQGYRLIDPGVPLSANAAAALPAGTVSIPTALSSDSYPERVGVTQRSERWDIQFLDAGGQVIATSAPTGDLPDQIESAVWQGSLGSVQLPVDAAYVRAHHRPDLNPDNSKNSVDPIEATFCWTEAPPTTTAAPTTTVAPTTTEAPATTAAPVTTTAPTTAAPTTAAPATTVAPAAPSTTEAQATVAPVDVLPANENRSSTPTPAPSPAPAPPAPKANTQVASAELARTGVDSDLLALIGVSFLSFGLALLRLEYRSR